MNEVIFSYRDSGLESLSPATFAGTLILVISLVLPVCYNEFRKDTGSLVLLWSLLFVYHAVSLINSFYTTTYGAGVDARAFYNHAVDIALTGDVQFHFGAGSSIFENYLGALFSFFGPSVFLASELSVLAFTFSAVYLVKMATITGLYGYRRWILFFFGSLPTMWLLSAVPMREAYQYLFFILTVYTTICMRQEKNVLFLPVIVFFAVCMGLFHKGLVLFIVPLVLVLFLYSAGSALSGERNRRDAVLYRFFLFAAFSVVVISGVIFVSQYPQFLNDTPKAVIKGEAFDYVEQYREPSKESRATYGIDFRHDNPAALLGSVVSMQLYYFLYPFPWKIANLQDLYAFLENSWRFFLILSSVFLVWKNRKTDNGTYAVLLLLYFVNSFLWGLGTINYGTAIRHHLVPFWIIVLLGTPGIIEGARKLNALYASRLLRTSRGASAPENHARQSGITEHMSKGES